MPFMLLLVLKKNITRMSLSILERKKPDDTNIFAFNIDKYEN